MNKDQAFPVLEQALEAANKAGVFKLQDSAVVFAALTAIKNELIKEEVSQTENKEDNE